MICNLNLCPPKGGGGFSEPPKSFCNNSLKKKGIEMKYGSIVNGLTTDLQISTKLRIFSIQKRERGLF